ncbi:hypothetical protein GCM10007877_26940 [Marinibactrum halimedae]|uniref:Uncharacterized protein n=1 Tax=Marinibactrum halimedae TaxID=1444977 RepID=A0AA37WN52_9GAMM|nr:hypothetical protein GCM10007877_26940 [Marinibactrum halimedae]
MKGVDLGRDMLDPLGSCIESCIKYEHATRVVADIRAHTTTVITAW